MLFGKNVFAEALLKILNLNKEETGRFRDCYLSDANTIVVYTRNGGGNREEYQSVIDKLKTHPNYKKDYDDDFDCTYCSIEFNVPEQYKEFIAKLTEEAGVGKNPKDKWKQLHEELKNRDSPEFQKIAEIFKPILDRLTQNE